jgi:RNA polymerase sigma factor (sigma-70 family)
MPQSDEQLLAELAAGKRTGLEQLARRYERPLLGLAAGVLQGRSDLACDAVQETWVRVIRFAGSFNGRSSVKTWLYRIALNQCRNLLSAGAAAALASARDDRRAPPEPAVANPSSAVADSERLDCLRAAVGRLDPDKRAVLLLCYHQGLTHEQAAEILEIPVGTLKSRLHAALRDLRERLNAESKP